MGGFVPAEAGPTRMEWTNQAPLYTPMPGDRFQKMSHLVSTRFEEGYAHWRGKFEQFYRFEKLVQMASKKKSYDWKANAFLPYPFAMSEQSASIKWLSLFETRPYVTVKARHPGLAEIADRRQALIDWHLSTGGDLDVVRNTLDMFRISERYGKVIALVVPEWEPNVVKYRAVEEIPTALGPIARIIWKMRESRDYRIRFIPQDNTDIIIQPGARRINGPQGCDWIERRYWLPYANLQALEQANLIGPALNGEPVQMIQHSNEQPGNEYQVRRLFLSQQDDVDKYRDKFERSVELIEYQGHVDREHLDPELAAWEEQNGRNPEERIILLANKKTVLMDIANPWDHGMKSYIEMDCVPEVYDFYGKGKVEPIEHLTYVANEIINMRLDNVKIAVNGLIGIDGRRMPPGWKRRLVSQPWGAVETKGPPNEVIQRLNLGDVTGSSYQEQQQLFTLIQEATAVNETLMGAPGKSRTLGEHRLKAESASKRLQFELVGQADQLLGFPYGLSGFIIGYDRQFLPLATYISVINPDYPDDFTQITIDHKVFETEDHHFIYLPTGATEGMNNQAKRLDLSFLMEALTPYIPFMMQSHGPQFLDELMKAMFKTYGFDPSRFMPRNPAMGMMPQGPGMGLGAQQGMMPGPGMMPGMAQGAGPAPGGMQAPMAGQIGGPQGA